MCFSYTVSVGEVSSPAEELIPLVVVDLLVQEPSKMVGFGNNVFFLFLLMKSEYQHRIIKRKICKKQVCSTQRGEGNFPQGKISGSIDNVE